MLMFNKKYFEYKKRENYVCDHNIIGNNHFTEKPGNFYEWWNVCVIRANNLIFAKVNLVHIQLITFFTKIFIIFKMSRLPIPVYQSLQTWIFWKKVKWCIYSQKFSLKRYAFLCLFIHVKQLNCWGMCRFLWWFVRFRNLPFVLVVGPEITINVCTWNQHCLFNKNTHLYFEVLCWKQECICGYEVLYIFLSLMSSFNSITV